MNLDEEAARFARLLDEEREEQAYQAYLEQNTRFIPREFVQNHGIGLSIILRTLSFGADYKTDFFYFSKSTDDWNAVFIELEKPWSRFFKGNTNEYHGDLRARCSRLISGRRGFSRTRTRRAFWRPSAPSRCRGIWPAIRLITSTCSSSGDARNTKATRIAGSS